MSAVRKTAPAVEQRTLTPGWRAVAHVATERFRDDDARSVSPGDVSVQPRAGCLLRVRTIAALVHIRFLARWAKLLLIGQFRCRQVMRSFSTGRASSRDHDLIDYLKRTPNAEGLNYDY